MDTNFITNLIKIFKRFNTSVNLAEQQFSSELFELLKSSKITLHTFDKLENDLKRIFRQNACALKTTLLTFFQPKNTSVLLI